MPVSVFRIERITLVAAAVTPITAPETCSSVGIANETGGDVLVSSDAAGAEYATLSDGLMMSIDLSQSGPGVASFRGGQVSFYLTSSGGGEVALFWI